MKKYLTTFLMIVFSVPAVADNWIKFTSQAVEDAINTLVAPENRQATADEYQKQMDKTTGKISVIGIYKVCAAAGNDINTNNGYSQCRYFINQIADKSGFGTKSATQANCANQLNGIWTLSADSKKYQCVGKDGYKLVYKKSCDAEDANSKCIKDFSGLKTQGPIGREFITEYAKKKNLQLTCHTGFETRRGITSPLGQDYIQCSAGGKSYEFEFDSLNQDPGKTSVESENEVMCTFFGGKIVKHPDSSIEKVWQSCDISSEICNGKIHSLALRIGHTTMHQGYCRLSREAKSTSYAHLHTIKGVDSKIFYNSGAQMRSDMAKVQLEEYLHNTFPNESYIVCDPTAKKFNYGFGIDQDYVMTCTVGSQEVDFLFQDLTEGRKTRADAGVDAMQCIISGGTFKGESCRGPTKDECTKLDVALRAKGSSEGAKWDDEVRACILGNAMKTYKQDVVTNYVVGAVVIVGVTIVVIGTGGLATPVVVGGAEMLVTDLAINYAIDANHRRLSKQAANRFGSFIADAEKCSSEQCALKALEKHYATLSGVWNDLNTNDQTVVNETIDRLIGLIKTEYVACGKNDKEQIVYATAAECAMKSSTLRVIDYIDKVSEPALIIGDIIYRPGYVATRFVRIKNISKVAKTMNVSYKEAKQLVKAGDVLHDATAVTTKADDASKYIDNALGIEKDSEGVVQTTKTEKIVDSLDEGKMSDYNIDDVRQITSRFGKDAVWRQSSTLGGQYYYRIVINDNDDVAGLIADLQRNGYFVSANQTTDGTKFIAVSKENIFQAWDNSPSNWLRGVKIGTTTNIDDFVRKYNKQAIFRPAANNSLGHDYYRIVIDDNDDVAGLIADLQRNGYFVSANQTTDGTKFIAVSKENIFQAWDNSPSNWLRGVKIGTTTNIDDFVRKYNKQAIFRPAANNSLGHDYYRIVIDDNDDVAGLIADLQRNGYFVSANQTTDGTKFIAVSKENIFQKWSNAPTNWLNGYTGGSVRGRGIFDKVYNGMPEDVLRRKLDYIYSVEAQGGSDHDIIQAMKHVGAFDEYRAGLLAQDIAKETVRRISQNPDLIRTGRNWRKLSEYEKKQFILEIHDVITRERRERVGNTVVYFDNSDPFINGWHRAPGSNNSRAFAYNVDNYTTVDEALNTIIHENVHSFQSVNKSSIPEQLIQISEQHYVHPKQNVEDYKNVLVEIESRYIAEHAVPRIIRELGW